jgi:hypothetical protein
MSTQTQGEHEFDVEVLVSGEEIRGYTAGEALQAGDTVAITGDLEVTVATDGGPSIGVAAYDVAQGEEVPVLGDDCEVRVEVSEAVNAGDALVPDGLGTVRQALSGQTPPEQPLAVANESGGSGELIQAYISASTGVLA